MKSTSILHHFCAVLVWLIFVGTVIINVNVIYDFKNSVIDDKI